MVEIGLSFLPDSDFPRRLKMGKNTWNCNWQDNK